MTVATVIYYSGYHPYTLKPVKTPKTEQDKKDQNRFFFWYKKENQGWIRNVLSGRGENELLSKLTLNNKKATSNPSNKKFVPHHAKRKNNGKN